MRDELEELAFFACLGLGLVVLACFAALCLLFQTWREAPPLGDEWV